MISANRFEMEARHHQQTLLQEAERARRAKPVQGDVVRVTGLQIVGSEFFARRFGGLVRRMKPQRA